MSVARSLSSNRNGHQWRRVRYSYMDCRRQARKRGKWFLEHAKYGIPLSPRLVCCGLNARASDSSALITIVSLNASGDVSLTLKMLEAIAAVLSEVHADRTGFRGFLAGAGRIELDTIREFRRSCRRIRRAQFHCRGRALLGT